jgi:ribosome-associated protein
VGSQEPLRVNSRLVLPGRELGVSFARSGGPGGQNVNKVSSKVVLRFSVRESPTLGERRRNLIVSHLKQRLTREGELVIHASSYREQARNLEAARERLATLLAEALRPRKTRKRTRPTAGSRERRLSAKKQRGQIKRQRRGDDS